MKIKKKKWGGQGGGGVGGEEGVGLGVRVDVIEELKFLGKFTKKNFRGGWFVGGRFGGVRVGGVRVDVNEELKCL